MSERACIAVVVSGVAVLAMVVPLLVAAKVAYGITPELPSVRIPVSTTYSASLLAGGVAAVAGGGWLLVRMLRRRHIKDHPARLSHTGDAARHCSAAGRVPDAGRAPSPILGRGRLGETAVLPPLADGCQAAGGQRADRDGYLPAPSGRPSTVAASALVRDAEAATHQMSVVRVKGWADHGSAGGAGKGPVPPALQLPVRAVPRAIPPTPWSPAPAGVTGASTPSGHQPGRVDTSGRGDRGSLRPDPDQQT